MFVSNRCDNAPYSKTLLLNKKNKNKHVTGLSTTGSVATYLNEELLRSSSLMRYVLITNTTLPK